MKQKILIIDDSEVDRKIIGRLIQRVIPGVDVIESENGLDVQALMAHHEIITCILDLRMPMIDGVEILRQLKGNAETADIPVIVCTGVADMEIMERVLLLGAYDYFTKPYSEEAMKYALPLKIRNAVDLNRRTRHIIHMSEIDGLTKLFNRRYFKDYVEQFVVSNADLPLTMLMCDINGLKVINDAFGNCAGDSILKNVAKILELSLPPNSICARWGGDEFAALIPNLNSSEISHLVSRIKLETQKIIYKEVSINIAIGAETIRSKTDSLLKLLKNSEDAMYRDKILENQSAHSAMIATILHTLNVKNPREEAHSRRVSELCEKIGLAMSLSESAIKDLKLIGLVHDIGKIAIDEHILNKPGKLTDEEYSEIKKHPEMGYRILSTSKEMDPYLDIILYHHERYDGKGYPNGLSGSQIPFMSRILTVIDSFDAMTCQRPYREAKSVDSAIEELIMYSGTQFDPEVVDVFVNKVLRFNH